MSYLTPDERYGTPGTVRPTFNTVTACRKGYYDYCLQGPSYAISGKHVPPHLCWAYETGAMAARAGQGLAKALHTLTLAHLPGTGYSHWDGFKSAHQQTLFK